MAKGRTVKHQDPLKLIFALPLPPAVLGPNVRAHHMAEARARKKYRNDCYLLTLEAMAEAKVRSRVPLRRFVLSAIYFYPVSRRRDPDNLTALLKTPIDALRDAGLVIDDHADHMRLVSVDWAVDKDHPRLMLDVEEVTE